jgi:MSHA pilin protein MshD
MRTARHMLGLTLVELIITIAILAMAAGTVLGVMSVAARGSAEAMVAQQAQAVANAYLQEALAKPFNDPALPDGEGARQLFDDVDDYTVVNDVGARTAANVAIPELANYNVTMAVVNTGGFGGIPAAAAKRVTVTVAHPSGLVVTATGYRTNYTP